MNQCWRSLGPKVTTRKEVGETEVLEEETRRSRERWKKLFFNKTHCIILHHSFTSSSYISWSLAFTVKEQTRTKTGINHFLFLYTSDQSSGAIWPQFKLLVFCVEPLISSGLCFLNQTVMDDVLIQLSFLLYDVSTSSDSRRVLVKVRGQDHKDKPIFCEVEEKCTSLCRTIYCNETQTIEWGARHASRLVNWFCNDERFLLHHCRGKKN